MQPTRMITIPHAPFQPNTSSLKTQLSMKTLKVIHPIFVFICFLFVSCSSDPENIDPVDYLQIPDAEFEKILIEQGIDSDATLNQQILKSDAAKVSTLNLEPVSGGNNIKDLTGIEGFINLKKLSAIQHEITTIDLSANSLLDTVFLMGNYISSFDVSNNPNLSMLDLTSNLLSSFTGVSKAIQLKELRLSFNYLEELNIDNSSIEALYVSDNDLKTFSANGAVNLKNILMKTNQLTSVDLSSNTLLETLVLSNNKIENLNIDQNTKLTHLWISTNSLTQLDVSMLSELVHLTVHGNPDLSCIKIQNGQYIGTVTKSDSQELRTDCE